MRSVCVAIMWAAEMFVSREYIFPSRMHAQFANSKNFVLSIKFTCVGVGCRKVSQTVDRQEPKEPHDTTHDWLGWRGLSLPYLFPLLLRPVYHGLDIVVIWNTQVRKSWTSGWACYARTGFRLRSANPPRWIRESESPTYSALSVFRVL